MEKLFGNSGKKIKWLVFVLWVVVTALSFFSAINLFRQASENEYLASQLIGTGFGVLIGGPLLAWLLGLTLYAFGELVEKVCRLEECLCKGIGK